METLISVTIYGNLIAMVVLVCAMLVTDVK